MSDPIRSISQNNYLLSAQQEVSHDNTLSGNGTEASPLGLNETVLYSNMYGRPQVRGGSITLSESPLNFEEVGIYLNGSNTSGNNNIANGYERVPTEQLAVSNGLEFIKAFTGSIGNNSSVHTMGCGYSGTSGTTWTKWYGYARNDVNGSVDFTNSEHLNIWKVVGINRIANN